jgi:hypothetical protein
MGLTKKVEKIRQLADASSKSAMLRCLIAPRMAGQALTGLIIKRLDLSGSLTPTVKVVSNGEPYRSFWSGYTPAISQ